MRDLFGHDVSPTSAAKSLDLQKAVARAAEWRKTPEYRQWLVESRAARKALKEKYRRQKGIKSREQKKAEALSKAGQKAEENRIRKAAQQLMTAHVHAWKKAKPDAWFRNKYRNDPVFNAKQKMRARVRRLTQGDSEVARLIASYARRDKWQRGWADLLGYGVDEFVEHLRRMVPRGYVWEDFLRGRLHIDHIIPRSAFDCSSVDGIRACWCLSNLQLLPAKANLKKSNRVDTLL